ncbi:hypothetical protein [Streptosporangium sp. NPDC004631]
MTTSTPSGQRTQPEEQDTQDAQDSQAPAVRRLGTWLVGAFGAGFTALIAATITGAWPWTADTVQDLRGSSPVRVVAESSIWPNDIIAMDDRLTSGRDHALLLNYPSNRELADMFRRHKAARVKTMTVTVIVEGLRSKPVRVIDVRPRVLSTAKRRSGTCIVFPPPQGESPLYLVKADLDTFRPPAGRSQFLKTSVDLKQDERLTVELTVKATRASHEWDVEVLYDYGGDSAIQRTYARQADGQPFRLSGRAKRYGMAFADPNGVEMVFRKISKRGRCG